MARPLDGGRITSAQAAIDRHRSSILPGRSMTLTANSQRIERNLRLLYADVAAYGLLAGSTLAFLTIFATQLGATAFEIGLLTAGPAAVQLALSLPAGRMLAGRSLVHSTFWSSVWHRLAYLLLIPLPWLIAPAAQPEALVLLVLVMSLPGTVLAIAFNALFADAVPAARRARVVGQRNALLAVVTTLTTLGCGQLLIRLPYPLNYQLVFTIGAAGAALSSWMLGQMRLAADSPERHSQPIGDAARPGLMRVFDAMRPTTGLRFLTRAQPGALLRPSLIRGDFGRLMGAYFFFYFFQFLPIPLFPLLFVRELGLSEWTISIGNGLFFSSMLLISLSSEQLAARWGQRRVLVLGALLYGQFPLLTALADGPALYLIASALGGAVWAVANVGLTHKLMDRVPPEDAPAHMALHNLVLNLGILAGSLLGPLLAVGLGLRNVLLLAAALRVLAGVGLARSS